MYQIDFHKPLHIHFIGIGGISMSGLAEILLGEDFKVSGSDSKESPLTDSLTRKGARIFYGQRASNITDDVELVVYTAAIHPDNPEYASAVEKGIPMLTRAQLLGQIMRNYDTPIAVSGTHGKTTTTSMISQILLEADADPTISVGGILPSIGGNIRVGQSETFVTEACEYTNSFLSFFPNREVILNIEADHLDFFKDIDDIRHSFRLFAERLPKDGTLIINQDIPNVAEITKDLPCGIISYALEQDADYTAANIEFDEKYRQQLEKQAGENGLEDLYKEAEKIDPEAMKKISENDKKRIIRVLEIYHATGYNKTEQERKSREKEPEFDYLVYGLNMPREKLYERINLRVDLMIEQGLIEEVENIYNKYK